VRRCAWRQEPPGAQQHATTRGSPGSCPTTDPSPQK
jgi:hypothetical protein